MISPGIYVKNGTRPWKTLRPGLERVAIHLREKWHSCPVRQREMLLVMRATVFQSGSPNQDSGS